MRTVKLTITASTGLLIGGYSDTDIFADKATARLSDGQPVIPASVIKGAIRHEFERMFASGCTLKKNCNCDACKLFGNEDTQTGLIRFEMAKLASDSQKNIFREMDNNENKYRPSRQGYFVRPGVSINRKLGTSEEKRHFMFDTTELFDKPLVFEVDLYLSDGLSENTKEWKHFKAATSAVFAIGGGKSRGFGHCTFKLDDIVEVSTAKHTLPTESDLKVKLTLPGRHLTIGADKPYDKFTETKDFIPGTTLRGAIANAILRSLPKDKQADTLTTLFTNSNAKFDDCLITAEGGAASFTVPLSAVSCKVHSGFKTQKEGKTNPCSSPTERHGVQDSLIPVLVRHLAELPVAESGKCPESDCKYELKPFTGYYHRENTKFKKCSNITIHKHIVTRTRQNRKLKSTEEGKLFSIESLTPTSVEDNLTFVGTIRNVNDELRPYLEKQHGQIISIGAETNLGYGAMKMELSSVDPGNSLDMAERLHRFNDKICTQLTSCRNKWTNLCRITDDHLQSIYFSVDLLANTILINKDNGLYQSLLDDDIKLTDSVNAKRVKGIAFARTELVGGFSFKVGNNGDRQHWPKRVQPAISRGSVFLYCIENVKEIDDELIQALSTLEKDGLGERKEEGFGHIRICDEFHFAQEVY